MSGLNDEFYIDLALSDCDPLGVTNGEMAQEVRWVREVFVEKLGWDKPKLSRYAFRALAEAARPGEVCLVKLKGAADYTTEMLPSLLERMLLEASEMPARQRRGYIQEYLMPRTPEVDEKYTILRLRASEDDVRFLTETAKKHGFKIHSHDSRRGNPDLAAALMVLLRRAYG